MKVSRQRLNTILLAVENGYKACEKGESLEQALRKIQELFKVVNDS